MECYQRMFYLIIFRTAPEMLEMIKVVRHLLRGEQKIQPTHILISESLGPESCVRV